jgi:hypothetical protein
VFVTKTLYLNVPTSSKEFTARDIFFWEECVGAIVVHFGGVLLENWLGLHMQVTHNGVFVPMANHLDEVFINFATEECHGSAGA